MNAVNQSLLSEPTMISIGPKLDGIWNSVMTPEVVMRPMWEPMNSVNQRLPSGPVTIPVGKQPTLGIWRNSVMTPEVVMRPMR